MKRFYFLLIVFLNLIFTISLSWGTAKVEQDSDSDAEKTQQIKEMFQSDYSDEMYFRTDRYLLTATKHIMQQKKAPAISSVINSKEIRNMGARNLMDVLKAVPGIGIVIPENPVKYAFEVRGVRSKNSEKILFLIDGHRVNNNIWGSATNLFNDLAIENVKRVEVIRGPGSALYGANAFVAVINVITKTAEDIDRLQVSAGRGSFDTQHYNFLYGYDGANFQISGFLDYLDSDGQSLYIEEDAQTLNDLAYGTDASLAPGNTDDWEQKIDFGLNLTYGDFTLSGRVIDKEKGPYIGVGRALNDETVMQFSQIFGDLTYNKRLIENFDITARLYTDFYRFDTEWEIFPEGFANLFPQGYLGHPETKNRTYGGEVTTNYALGATHLFTTGFNYEDTTQYDTKSTGNFDPITYAPLGMLQEQPAWNQDVTRRIWAIYFQDVWQIKQDLSLTTGVRYDNYSDFGDTTNPRAGLVWEIIEDIFTVKLLYGSAFRAPSFVELYNVNNPGQVGNPDLKPEKIDTYEIGFEYRFFKHSTFKLNYFYNDIEDLITLGAKPSSTEPAPYINKGKATIDGIETELVFNFSKDNYGYLNYTYQDPRDGETDERLAYVPNWRAKIGLNWELLKYLNANIHVSWIGDRPREEEDTRDDLSSTAIVDMTLILRKFYKSLELRGSVYNLFDVDYRDPSPYPVEVTNDFPNSARTFFMEVRYTF